MFYRLFPVRPSETRAVLWSFLYIFALFLAYYVLRPIRDEWGWPAVCAICRGCLPAHY